MPHKLGKNRSEPPQINWVRVLLVLIGVVLVASGLEKLWEALR